MITTREYLLTAFVLTWLGVMLWRARWRRRSVSWLRSAVLAVFAFGVACLVLVPLQWELQSSHGLALGHSLADYLINAAFPLGGYWVARVANPASHPSPQVRHPFMARPVLPGMAAPRRRTPCEVPGEYRRWTRAGRFGPWRGPAGQGSLQRRGRTPRRPGRHWRLCGH